MKAFWDAMLPGPTDIRKMEYEFVHDEEDDSLRKVWPGGDGYESVGSLGMVSEDDIRNKESNRLKKTSNIPYARFINPYSVRNAGIYLSYFNVGIAMYILQA